jgi:hypothetical protein
MMNHDTISLLKECNAGSKMATNSMEQIHEYLVDDKLRRAIDRYNEKHIMLGEKITQLLREYGEDEKDPDKMAKVFSWLTTEVKMMFKDDAHQVAKIMMDGCNMGIQSLSEYMNKYVAADEKSMELAKELVKIEEDFMKDLKEFL